MTEAGPSQTLDPTPFGAGREGLPARPDDRTFLFYVVAAMALHSLLLVGFNSGEPRRLGDTGGADDAISVSLITEADLKGKATVEDRAAGVPAPPAPAAQPAPVKPPTPAPQPQPAEAASPVPLPEPEPAKDPAKEPAKDPAKEPAKDPAKEPVKEAIAETAKDTALDLPPSALVLSDPGLEPAPKAAKSEAAKASEKTALEAKPAEAKPRPAKPAEPKPETKTAKLDLSPPAVFAAPLGGGGAGVQRPAGITRSGENDAFARGVIRALQQTMPQLRNTFGRVTVRITLDMRGNLARTEVVNPSRVGGLDQSVVFATQQSSFPFPPHNAVPADLVFVVTYIYR